jgi:cell cycle arrest protein BUB3
MARVSYINGTRLTVGWASGSIEGRIAVEYFDADPSAQAQKYAFRAHRQTVDGVDCVYPINALAYHPM